MTYPESKDPRTDKAPEHRKNALGNKGKDISNAEIIHLSAPTSFEGLTLKDGKYRIARGDFKGISAFRCHLCSRSLVKSGTHLVCEEHGPMFTPIDLRKIGKDDLTTEWALERYKMFLGEAKDEGFDSVETYVDHLVKTQGESYIEYAKLGVGLEKTFKAKSKAKPTPANLFTYESVEETKNQLRKGLDFPYVNVQSSILGGKENVSILIKISKDPESEWVNKIFHNSVHAQIHIENDGVTEQFVGWKLKMRKFKGKSIDQIIDKINKIKVVE